MQKLKAAGFNTVSTYFFWGLIEAKRGVFHWDGFPDPQSFFDAAREAGMHVIARPGPYINAEVSCVSCFLSFLIDFLMATIESGC